MIKLKDLMLPVVSPRPLHEQRGRPDFGDMRKSIGEEIETLAAGVRDTSWPAFADMDRDPYDSQKEAAAIKSMEAFARKVQGLAKEWAAVQKKHKM